jgi:hypothetical protein
MAAGATRQAVVTRTFERALVTVALSEAGNGAHQVNQAVVRAGKLQRKQHHQDTQ